MFDDVIIHCSHSQCIRIRYFVNEQQMINGLFCHGLCVCVIISNRDTRTLVIHQIHVVEAEWSESELPCTGRSIARYSPFHAAIGAHKFSIHRLKINMRFA